MNDKTLAVQDLSYSLIIGAIKKMVLGTSYPQFILQDFLNDFLGF